MAKVSRVVLIVFVRKGVLYHVILERRLTSNPSGAVGAELKFTAQSMKVCVPLIAKTMVFMSSIGTDLMTMAFVPVRQSESTWVSFSCPPGFE